MLNLLDNAFEHLILKTENTADWRRQKAIEFPGDLRNLRAAEALDRLALWLREIPAESPFRAFYAGLDLAEDAAETLNDYEDAMLRSVGFGANVENAEHLLGAIIMMSEV